MCGDQEPLVLMSKCHFTAPLRAIKTETTLELRCYLPECDALVQRFELKGQ